MNGHCDKCDRPAAKVHRFPRDPGRAKEWVDSLAWKDVDANGKKLENLYICDVHFTKDAYRNGNTSNPLIYGAKPTISMPLTPIPFRSDHDYMGNTHPRMRKESDTEMEVDDNEPITVPPPMKDCSQQSQRTDITWNSIISSGRFTNSELFADKETVGERNIRRKEESASMQSTDMNYSLLASESLLELLDFTPGCLKCRNISAKRTFRTIGTAVEMQTDCPNCKKWTWCSSKKVHDDKLGGLTESNMDMGIATYICGIPYERMEDLCRTMKLGIPRRMTHYEIIRNHVKPVVDTMYLEDMVDTRERIFSANKPASNNQKAFLSLVGDAQFDSRGFSASICRYIIMDYRTRLIVDFEVQIKKENQGNSPIMESRAFAKIMERLAADDKFSIERITTDKNASVIAHLHKNYPHVQHCLDKWHVLKLVKKHYLAIVERKKNMNLRAHWDQLLVHIWVSIEAAEGNGDFAVELIRSAEFHLQNIHDLPQSEFSILKNCMHGPLQDDPSNPRAWLDPVAHKSQIAVLHELLNNPTFLENVRRCAARETTSPCESFHSLAALIYLKKNTYYDKNTTTTLTKLCVLHHNSHRKEILDRERLGVVPPTRKKYSRAQKRVREVIHQPKPSLLWKRTLLQNVKEHYFKKKEDRVANRVMGRPKIVCVLTEDPTESSPRGDESSDEDVDPLDDHDSETEENDEEATYLDELSTDTLVLPPQTQSCNLMYPPAVPMQIIKVSPRRYDIVYASMGADADNYIYVHNRTGERIIP